jgi:transcriptional regulator with XRE-family HTH domain
MESIHPLKAFRESQDPPLSQQQLADLVGVDRVTVTRWESGSRKIEAERLPVIAEKTGIAPSDLRPDLADLMRFPEPGRVS